MGQITPVRAVSPPSAQAALPSFRSEAAEKIAKSANNNNNSNNIKRCLKKTLRGKTS